VSESVVGVEGVATLNEPDESRSFNVADEGVAKGGERESVGVPIVRVRKSSGFSPTWSSSGTCSSSYVRCDVDL